MGKTYLEGKILTDPNPLRCFLQGFNREHALSYFIDAGDDKEAADSKVKGARGFLLTVSSPTDQLQRRWNYFMATPIARA